MFSMVPCAIYLPAFLLDFPCKDFISGNLFFSPPSFFLLPSTLSGSLEQIYSIRWEAAHFNVERLRFFISFSYCCLSVVPRSPPRLHPFNIESNHIRHPTRSPLFLSFVSSSSLFCSSLVTTHITNVCSCAFFISLFLFIPSEWQLLKKQKRMFHCV